MKKESYFEVCRALYQHKGRPETATAVDLSMTVYLLLRGADEKPVRASAITIGMAIGVADRTVRTAVIRLRALGWIQVQSGKGRMAANLYSVILDKLPVADELKHTVISPAMQKLAADYTKATQLNLEGKKRRFGAVRLQQMASALQWFLDKHCEGDEILLRRIVNFALLHPKYATKARRGPHELRKHFAKILAEFKSGGAIPTVAEPAKPTAQPPVNPDAHPWEVPPLPSNTGQVVYKFQNLVAVGLEEFRSALNTAELQDRESTLFIVQPDGAITEKQAIVRRFGTDFSLRSLMDLKTERSALPSSTVPRAA